MKKYMDFKEYIGDNFYNEIYKNLKPFIIRQRDTFENDELWKVSWVDIDDLRVSGVTFKEIQGDDLEIRASVDANIDVQGKTRSGHEQFAVIRTYNVFFQVTLKDGLHNVKIIDIDDYNEAKFERDRSLSQELVPYLYEEDVEKKAEDFLRKHYPKALLQPMAIPVEKVAQEMGMKLYYAPLEDKIFGKTYFGKEKVTVYTDIKKTDSVEIITEPGTVLINPDVFFMYNVGTANNTIIHECVHWDQHRRPFELQRLLNGECNHISCEIVEKYDGFSKTENALKWMEWQANQLAPRILMPAQMTKRVFDNALQAYYTENPQKRYAELLQETVDYVAHFFNVSIFAAKLRLIELGYDRVQGTFVYSEKRYLPPFSFKKGSIGNNQTYVVDEKNAVYVMFFNPTLRQLFIENKIVYANSMICINSPKYIEANEYGFPILTEYALEHVDECCFIFDRKINASQSYKDTFYRRCFLCRNVVSDTFIEASYDPEHGDNQDKKERCKNLEKIADMSNDLSSIMEEVPSGFGAALRYHMKRKDINEEELSFQSHVSTQTISKYINDSSAEKKYSNVVAVVKALYIHPIFMEDLLEKAGYKNKMGQGPFFVKYLIWQHPDDTVDEWQHKIDDAHVELQLPKERGKK